MIEEYDETENDALDAFDVTSAPIIIRTFIEKRYKGVDKHCQKMQWVEADLEVNQAKSLDILKTTSKNATKRLKMRAITKTGKFT